MPMVGAALSNSRLNAKILAVKDAKESAEFINVASASVQGSVLDGASLLGVMPNKEHCIIHDVVMKLNHEFEWTPRQLALTVSNVCFSFVGEDCMRDNIFLHEVLDEHLLLRAHM
jgi:hypothetical protein